MNKNKAVKILENQIKKLEEYQNGDSLDLWIIQTEYYINDFFHDNSFYVDFFKKLTSPRIVDSNYERDFDALKIKLKVLLMSCIETIKDIDVKKPDGRNFLYHLNDTWLTTLIIFSATLFFQVGIFYQKAIDKNNYTIEIKSDKQILPIDNFINDTCDTSNGKSGNNPKNDTCRH